MKIDELGNPNSDVIADFVEHNKNIIAGQKSEIQQLANGKWVSATYLKYPPTWKERLRHWLNWCEPFCFICRDAHYCQQELKAHKSEGDSK